MTRRVVLMWKRSFATALVVASVTACAKHDAEGASDSVHAEVAVRTAVVTVGPFAETVSAIGDVVPRAGHVAALSAPAPTRVAQVFVVPGQHVAKGARLVELEQAVFQASERSAQAAVDAAQRNFDRQQRLVDIVPRKDLDQAASDLALAKSNLVAAQRASELSVLHAPIDGVVTRVNAVLGASVDVSQTLVEVADPSAVDIVLAMTPADAGRVHVGAVVVVRSGQSAAGDTLGRGTIVDVGGVVDTTTRSVAVRVQPTTTRRTLRIGETVSGDIAIGTQVKSLSVPNDALVPAGDGFKVFVVDSASVAHEREVTVGARTGGMVQIVKGVSAGERVVTYGAYGIEDGAKVVAAKP